MLEHTIQPSHASDLPCFLCAFVRRANWNSFWCSTNTHVWSRNNMWHFHHRKIESGSKWTWKRWNALLVPSAQHKAGTPLDQKLHKAPLSWDPIILQKLFWRRIKATVSQNKLKHTAFSPGIFFWWRCSLLFLLHGAQNCRDTDTETQTTTDAISNMQLQSPWTQSQSPLCNIALAITDARTISTRLEDKRRRTASTR